jgi:hypothetical protein
MNFDLQQVPSSTLSDAIPKRLNTKSQKPTPDDTMRQVSDPQRGEIRSFTQAAKPDSKRPSAQTPTPKMSQIDLPNFQKTHTYIKPTYAISTPSNLPRKKSPPLDHQRFALKLNLPATPGLTESDPEPSKPVTTTCLKKTKEEQRLLY